MVRLIGSFRELLDLGGYSLHLIQFVSQEFNEGNSEREENSDTQYSEI